MNATLAPRFRLGPYELLLSLASGGMSSVVLARQHGAAGFERLVVVKRVHRRHLDNKEFSNMFRDEARLASSIRHSNVASVVDVIEEQGELCLVMEYFESLSLARVVEIAAQKARVAPGVASRIVSDTLAGLHAAHEAVDIRRNRLGIVHRDVSPQNVIVDVGGVSRVIDFGIAKAETRITHTKSGFVKGKLGYMSPEQIEALPVDRRSDLFSTGIVLHELLTGKRLFSGDDEFDTMRRVLGGEIPDPSREAPELGPAVDGVLRKALARSVDDRFQTALAFQGALERAIPPAPAHEVGGLVSLLGKEELDERNERLLELLGDELEKLSPRSPGRAHPTVRTLIDQGRRGLVDAPPKQGPEASAAKGHTLPLFTKNPVVQAPGSTSVDPHGPTLRDVVVVAEALPTATLRSVEDPPLEAAVSGATTPRAGPGRSLPTLLAVAFSAVAVGAAIMFLAFRPAAEPEPASPPVASSPGGPTATAPSVPPRSTPAVADTTASAEGSVVAPRPPPTKPPVTPAVTSPRPKPPLKPVLQPNPYD
jgi:serine/threonine protein kinase